MSLGHTKEKNIETFINIHILGKLYKKEENVEL
jgi:hypothetical protein